MFVDGNWVGISRDPLDLTTHLVSMRRKDIIDISISKCQPNENYEDAEEVKVRNCNEKTKDGLLRFNLAAVSSCEASPTWLSQPRAPRL